MSAVGMTQCEKCQSDTTLVSFNLDLYMHNSFSNIRIVRKSINIILNTVKVFDFGFKTMMNVTTFSSFLLVLSNTQIPRHFRISLAISSSLPRRSKVNMVKISSTLIFRYQEAIALSDSHFSRCVLLIKRICRSDLF